MADYAENAGPLDEIEALIRQAGHYVRASDDLRPRVLEAARLDRYERRAKRKFWQAAAVLVLLGLLTTVVRHRVEAAADRVHGHADHSFSWETTGSSWEMVESFTELRRRQAEMLRPPL